MQEQILAIAPDRKKSFLALQNLALGKPAPLPRSEFYLPVNRVLDNGDGKKQSKQTQKAIQTFVMLSCKSTCLTGA